MLFPNKEIDTIRQHCQRQELAEIDEKYNTDENANVFNH